MTSAIGLTALKKGHTLRRTVTCIHLQASFKSPFRGLSCTLEETFASQHSFVLDSVAKIKYHHRHTPIFKYLGITSSKSKPSPLLLLDIFFSDTSNDSNLHPLFSSTILTTSPVQVQFAPSFPQLSPRVSPRVSPGAPGALAQYSGSNSRRGRHTSCTKVQLGLRWCRLGKRTGGCPRCFFNING